MLLNSHCILYKSAMEEVRIWGWPLQTAGLLTTGFSSRSFTILSGRVTEVNAAKLCTFTFLLMNTKNLFRVNLIVVFAAFFWLLLTELNAAKLCTFIFLLMTTKNLPCNYFWRNKKLVYSCRNKQIEPWKAIIMESWLVFFFLSSFGFCSGPMERLGL